ncbi:MAG: hypothetical protein IJV13_00255 [Prevotella sp.]|nr:hypothetical protein [Prevotella sp.]MBQ9650640.1 hypothetical protein [Prevotella sp.]
MGAELSTLIGNGGELADLRQLLAKTRKEIDDASESGNEALLNLQLEYEELAEKKRELLREIEKLENQRDGLQDKLRAAENTYGQYLKQIRAGKKGE